MKIVEIINCLSNRNGAQTFLVNLCKAFQKNNYVEIHLISIYGNVDQSILDDIESAKLNFYTLEKKKRIDFQASSKLKTLIKRIKPDIVHMHLSCLPTYFLAFGFAKQSFKLFQTFHTIPTNEFGFLQKIFVSKHLITYVGISNEITEIANKLDKRIECFTIFNGIPLHDNRENSLNKRKFDFVIVASMTPVKNHELLFNALALVKKQYDKVILACVGDGPLLERNKNLVNNLNLSENVFFAGATDNVRGFLEQSKCFVLSSTREGNPISILEAMDAGLPIVAPRVGGIPDVVLEDVNGFLFEPNDLEALARIMIFILKNNQTIQKIGLSNKDYVKRFDIIETSNSYYDIFKMSLSFNSQKHH